MFSNTALEPTADGALSSAFAVHAIGSAWLGFDRSPVKLETIQPGELSPTPASAAFTPATSAATRTGNGKSDGASNV